MSTTTQTTARTWGAKPRQKPRGLASELAEAEVRVAKESRFLGRVEAHIADRIAAGKATETWPDGSTTTYWMTAALKWRDAAARDLKRAEWQLADARVKLAA
jgi:hypothetical protein